MECYYKTFISVGNAKQHYFRLLNAVHTKLSLLPKPILIQCGYTPFISHECDVIDFIQMDNFIRYVDHADIIITHAGAGSVLHAVKAGKRPILMPRRAKFHEHVNNHQVDFAQALHDSGKALMVENEEELELAIIQSHNSKAVQMTNDNNNQALVIIKSVLHHLLKE